VTVGAVLAAAGLGPHWPAGAVGLLLASGGVLFLHLARRACPDRRLALVVGLCYGLRAAVAIAFFVTSASALPILSGLQLGEGFWKFAPDAGEYHQHALFVLANGLCSGWMYAPKPIDLFGAAVGSAYWWFAPHPLVAITLNVWAAAATTLLAFSLARSIGGSDGPGLAAATLVALWPSALLWSSQLLREPMFLLLLFLVLVLVDRLLSAAVEWRATLLLLAAVFGATFLLAKSRHYSGWILLASFLGAAGIVAAARGPARWTMAGCCGAVMVAGVWAGVTQPLWVPVLPAHRAEVRGAPVPENCGAETPHEMVTLPTGPPSPLEYLARVRHGYRTTNGELAENARVDTLTSSQVLREVPSTVAKALLAPVPWSAPHTGNTGVFRTLAAIEVLGLALLLPALVAGSIAVVTRKSLVGVFALAYGLVVWFLLALVVVNEGTLFRLRLQGVLPVLVVSVAGGGLELYRRAAARIGRWVGA
jgi:hypothetical protein